MSENNEEKKCHPIHKWGGAMIVVDAEKMEVQFPELMGLPCDCGKFIWHEESCGCANNPHWGAKVKENVQH